MSIWLYIYICFSIHIYIYNICFKCDGFNDWIPSCIDHRQQESWGCKHGPTSEVQILFFPVMGCPKNLAFKVINGDFNGEHYFGVYHEKAYFGTNPEKDGKGVTLCQQRIAISRILEDSLVEKLSQRCAVLVAFVFVFRCSPQNGDEFSQQMQGLFGPCNRVIIQDRWFYYQIWFGFFWTYGIGLEGSRTDSQQV